MQMFHNFFLSPSVLSIIRSLSLIHSLSHSIYLYIDTDTHTHTHTHTYIYIYIYIYI